MRTTRSGTRTSSSSARSTTSSKWIAHPTLDHADIRATLYDIEAANSVTHGYGTRVFLRSLHDCFEHLLEREPTVEDRKQIEALAAPLLAHAIEPIAGVEATLEALELVTTCCS
jgi:putative hydrolase of the HAD superfamily